MGLRIFWSDRIERLAGELAESLRAQGRRAGADLFVAARVIVPNMNVRKWLQLFVARHTGVCLNIQFQFLEDGFEELLAPPPPPVGAPAPASGTERLDREDLQQMILALLLAEGEGRGRPKRGSPLAPLLSYLGPRDEVRDRDFSRRAWQLSGALASLFMEYERQRRDLIAEWMAPPATAGRGGATSRVKAEGAMEAAQRVLYQRLFAPGGLRDQLQNCDGLRRLTLPQLARESRIAAPPPAGPIHLFGFPSFSDFYYETMAALSKTAELSVYQLSFHRRECAGASALPAWARCDGSDAARPPGGGNELLRQWGTLGRDNLISLARWTDEFAITPEIHWLDDPSESPARSDRFDDAAAQSGSSASDGSAGTLLHKLQRRIVGDEGVERGPQDRSIQIAGCPSVLREVETVYHSILDNLSNDAGLQLTDIAVLVTDMERYEPAIRSVFEREPRVIAYNLSDATAAADSLFARGVMSLLALVDSSFARSEVFDLVLNPCFLAAAGLSRADAREWIDWAAQLRIFHDFEPGPSAHAPYTWGQGLRRLRLGRIMEAPEGDGATAPGGDYRGLIPYRDMASGDERAVGRFGRIIESLYRRTRALKGRRRTCAQWADDLMALSDAFLAVPPDRPEEEPVWRQLREALRRFADFDATLQAAGVAGGISLPVAVEFVSAHLAGIPSRHGRYLTDGVTVSSLKPLRPIPFQIVYILGLEEGRFPGAAPRSTLDLRSGQRRPGDAPPPESNRYLFLEILMSTRRKLYLTYVSKNLQKDEDYHPCSVVNQLQGFLEREILSPEAPGLMARFRRFEAPLHGSSDKYLRRVDFNEHPVDPRWSDLLVNRSAADRIACLIEARERGQLRLTEAQALALDQWAQEALVWRRPPAPGGGTCESAVAPWVIRALKERELRVSLSELARFLLNPIEAGVRRHLRLGDAEAELDDEALTEDEAFFSTHLEQTLALRGIIERFVAAEQVAATQATRPPAPIDQAARAHQAAYERWQLQGIAPAGAFGELDRETQWEQGRRLLEAPEVGEFLKSRRDWEWLRGARIESGTSCDPGLLQFPELIVPLSLTVDGREERFIARLSGEIPMFWRNERQRAGAILVPAAGSYRNEPFPTKHLLEPYLFYLAARASAEVNTQGLCAREWIGDGPFEIAVLYKACFGRWSFRADPEDARQYLTDLIGDYLLACPFDHLPFDIILTGKGVQKWKSLADAPVESARQEYLDFLVRQMDDDDNLGLDASLSGLQDIVLLMMPPDAWDKVRRRYALREGMSLFYPFEVAKPARI